MHEARDIDVPRLFCVCANHGKICRKRGSAGCPILPRCVPAALIHPLYPGTGTSRGVNIMLIPNKLAFFWALPFAAGVANGDLRDEVEEVMSLARISHQAPSYYSWHPPG